MGRPPRFIHFVLARPVRLFTVAAVVWFGMVAISLSQAAGAYGVIKLRLHPGSYNWQFLPTGDKGFRDSGSGTCH
jgi:hypothetical protein